MAFPVGQWGARTLGSPVAPAGVDPAVYNPVRIMAFRALLCLLFFRFSLLHEVLAYYTGGSTYILYVFTIPALIGLTASGGFARALSSKSTKLFLAFVLWMLLAIPFSTWRGDSTTLVMAYGRTHLPMLFLIGGLVVTWEECRKVFYVIALAAMVNVALASFLAQDYGDRMGLEFGVVSNPNDYAAHVIFMLPMILFLVFGKRIPMPMSMFVKVGGLAGIVMSLYLILKTASRGALIAMVLGVLFMFWKSSMKARIATVFLVPVLGIVLWSVVPDRVRDRLTNMNLGSEPAPMIGNGAPSDEADESSRLRRFLLEESIRITFDYPIFGVGPGQFGNFEKRAALWRSTHNTYTQVSSESGIPALLFLVGGMLTSLFPLGRTWKRAKSFVREPVPLAILEIRQACYCLMLTMIMFSAAIFFLNFAYFFYLPALAGMMLAVSRGGDQEMEMLAREQAPKVSPQAVVASAPMAAAWQNRNATAQTEKRASSKFRFNRYR